MFSCLLVSLGIQFFFTTCLKIISLNREGRSLVNTQIMEELAGKALPFECLILSIREIHRSYAHLALSHLRWCVSFLPWHSASCWVVFWGYLQLPGLLFWAVHATSGWISHKGQCALFSQCLGPIAKLSFLLVESWGFLDMIYKLGLLLSILKSWSGPQELKL